MAPLSKLSAWEAYGIGVKCLLHTDLQATLNLPQNCCNTRLYPHATVVKLKCQLIYTSVWPQPKAANKLPGR